MSDIFLSYARKDAARARTIARALEQEGWSVFWDPKIAPAEHWRDVIRSELEAAHCVVVLWSAHSAQSRWVLEEAEEAQRRNILIPARLEAIEPPFGFRTAQAADLIGWGSVRRDPRWLSLLGSIERHSPRKTAQGMTEPPSRPEEPSAKALTESRVASTKLRIQAVFVTQSVCAGALAALFQVMSLEYSTGTTWPWNKVSLVICMVVYAVSIVAGYAIKGIAQVKFARWQRHIAIGAPLLTVVLAGIAGGVSEGDLIQLMSVPFALVTITGVVSVVSVTQVGSLNPGANEH